MSSPVAEPQFSTSAEQILVDALPAALLQLNGHGQIVFANECAQQWLGAPLYLELWRDISAREFSDTLEEGYLSARRGKILAINTAPLTGIPGQLVLLTDVSETYTLQKSVGREARLIAMGEMMARLAHQVRTPVAAALLYTSQMRRAVLKPEQLTQMAGKVLERLYTIEDMVKDMMMFTHGTQGEACWEDLDQFFSDVTKNIESIFEIREISFKYISNIKGKIFIQKVAMSSAIINLLDNASRHAQPGAGAVTLEVGYGDAGLTISVEDNGPGIDNAALEKIFEPFYTSRSDGTGLGLPVVQAVVRNHDGVLDVGDAALGGARFVAILPEQRFKYED